MLISLCAETIKPGTISDSCGLWRRMTADGKRALLFLFSWYYSSFDDFFTSLSWPSSWFVVGGNKCCLGWSAVLWRVADVAGGSSGILFWGYFCSASASLGSLTASDPPVPYDHSCAFVLLIYFLDMIPQRDGWLRCTKLITLWRVFVSGKGTGSLARVAQSRGQ